MPEADFHAVWANDRSLWVDYFGPKCSSFRKAPTTPATAPSAEPKLQGARSTAPPSKPKSRWYGWQTLSSDLASIWLVLVPSVSDKLQAAVVAGVAGYCLSSPVIHLAHGSVPRALGSVGMRLGALGSGVFLMYLAIATQDDGSEPDPSTGTLIAIYSAALATPIVIDATLLAYEPVEEPAQSVRVAPALGFDRHGARLGVGGVF